MHTKPQPFLHADQMMQKDLTAYQNNGSRQTENNCEALTCGCWEKTDIIHYTEEKQSSE
jgi:hypothetical protein